MGSENVKSTLIAKKLATSRPEVQFFAKPTENRLCGTIPRPQVIHLLAPPLLCNLIK